MSLYRLQYLNAPIAKAVATGRALYSVGIVVPLVIQRVQHSSLRNDLAQALRTKGAFADF